MSRRALCIAAALLALARPAAPQDLDSLRRAVDSLHAEYVRADAASDAFEIAQARRRQSTDSDPLDSARVGPFLVVTAHADSALVVSRFERAWRELQPVIGNLGTRVRPLTYVVQANRPVRLYVRQGKSRSVSLTKNIFGGIDEDRARNVVAQALADLVPLDVRFWAGTEFLAAEMPWTSVYRSLAASSAIPSTACFKGELAACRVALSLVDAGERMERWYTPEQIRRFVLSSTGYRNRPERLRCSRGNDDECFMMLQPGMVPAPLSGAARAGLLHIALQRGGNGALERLAADTGGTVQDRLVRVAGVPLDTLLHEWRTRTLAARPAVHAGLAVGLGATVFWSLLFLFLAARSTRCRAG